MIPFFTFYSMFGFQRVGDLWWAFADQRGKGFLMGGTAGRTTLLGEGLQHQDGHSPILASVVPTCAIYDPAYAYELAVIIQDGIRRMYQEMEDRFYYITVYNENYQQPPMPEIDGIREGILAGIYKYRPAADGPAAAQLFGSGSILNEALRAQQILAERYQIPADVWSVTSYNQLRREALAVERWNRLHPSLEPKDAAHRPGARRRAGADYRRIRLHQSRARSARAVARRKADAARHRRLRPQRKSRASTPILRNFRGSHRAGDALRPRAHRRHQHETRGNRHRGAGFPSRTERSREGISAVHHRRPGPRTSDDARSHTADARDVHRSALRRWRRISPGGGCILPTGTVLHSMAGAWGKYLGTKVYTDQSAPRAAYFFFLLFDAETAKPLAYMEANHLGQIRTGAASGYATDLLVKAGRVNARHHRQRFSGAHAA